MEHEAPILKVEGLVKIYGDVTAVDHISFEVKKGEIFGFLGPNGAGKTTSISMICGLLKPDKGSVSFLDKGKKGYKEIKHRIGLCPQDIVIWDMLTCIEQLEFTGEMYGLDRKAARAQGKYLLSELGLSEKEHKLASTLSGGMKRRLNIALALVHDPELLILDEPQAGLDPQSRILVREFIRKIAKRTTVLLTTHDMDEADRLSDRIAIIDNGKILVMDTPENLKRNIGLGDILEISIDYSTHQKASVSANTAATAVNHIKSKLEDMMCDYVSEFQKYTFIDNKLLISCTSIFELLPKLIERFKSMGISVQDVKIRRSTLEDVFISLTGRGLRE